MPHCEHCARTAISSIEAFFIMDKQCKVEGCSDFSSRLGYCNKHYKKYKKYGNPLTDKTKKKGLCTVIDCNRIHRCNGYCELHNYRFSIYGNPLTVKKVFGDNRSKHPLYRIYNSMKTRCSVGSNSGHLYYSDRGIKVCDRWLGTDGFNNFVLDMGERPKGHSIDRIDVNGNYEPSNCSWATIHQQCSNRRSNKKRVGVTYRGSSKKWSAELRVDSKIHKLGCFSNFNDAVKARELAELKYNIKVK